jgi:Zn-dependent M28 family amino/carboxypeptidase
VRLHVTSFCKEVDTANIVVKFPGRTADTIVLGAHFDTWDLGQGALDNGLGTAQLFAVAKLLHEHAPQNLRTVELVWFNGEEQGLWGSRHHAPTLKGRPITAMINLDMVGFPTSVNALGCTELVPLLHQFNATLGARKLTQGKDGVDNVNWFGSDQTPYQLQGIRTITFGATIPPEDVRYYHDFGDTFDKVSPEIVGESSATVAALTYWLANEPGLDATRMSPQEAAGLFAEKGLEERMRELGLWTFGDVSAAPAQQQP